MRLFANTAAATIALFALSAGAPAFAQNTAETVEAKVKVGDLNLRSQAGKETLANRIETTAKNSCATGGMDLASKNAENQCRAEMEQDGALKGRMAIAEQNRAARLEAERVAALNAKKTMTKKKATRVAQKKQTKVAVQRKVAQGGR